MQFCGFEGNKGIHQYFLRKLGFHRRTNKTLASMEKTIRKIGCSTNISCDYADRQDRGRVPWGYYGDGQTMKFEHLFIKVPSKTDAYLTYKYGNWKAELPLEQRVTHHNTVVCDLNRSYITYMDKIGMLSAPAVDI
jgi:hypothetical protein